MTSVKIRGKEIRLMQRDCVLNGCGAVKSIDPFVDISVCMTNDCNGRCPFCCNAGKKSFTFCVSAFEDFFDEVCATVHVNKVTFTGGETTMFFEEMNYCLDHVQGRCDLVTVNTNGYLLHELNHPAIDRIALSRHHAVPEKNDELFGAWMGNPLEMTNFFNHDKVVLACVLMRGGTENARGMAELMDFAAENGVREAAFYGMMPISQWCADHRIDLQSIKFDEDVVTFRRYEHEIPDVCECSNHAYVAKNGEMVLFYMRHNKNPAFDKGSRIVWENNQIA